MIEHARDHFGRIHMLINAAGAEIGLTAPMLKLDEWDWRRMMEVNLTGAFFCSQLLGRVMAEEGGGMIVNIASTAGHPDPLPQGVAYVASKSGMIGLTKQCAQELAPQGIRVNAVCPGNIEILRSRFSRKMLKAAPGPATRSRGWCSSFARMRPASSPGSVSMSMAAGVCFDATA